MTEERPLPSGFSVVDDLADAFEHPVFLLDGERRVASCNRIGREYIRRIWGRDVALGDSMDEYSVPDALAAFQRNHRRAMEGERVVVNRPLAYANGEERFYRICYQPVRDEDGAVRGVLFFAEDRTEEFDAARRSKLYEAALDQSAQGVAIGSTSEPHFPLVFVSEGFERLTGYSQQELLGKSCSLLQGPGTDSETVDGIREALRAGRPHRAEILNFRKDGSSFWNELSLFPVRNEAGALTHFLGFQVDVTERRRLEERLSAVERLESLGLLAGGIAHDFNNLLAALWVNVELLQPSAANAETVRAIVETLRRGRDLTTSLLDFARARPSEPRRIDLRDNLEAISRLLEPLLTKRIELLVNLPDHPLPVHMDPAQLDQVVMNLVLNARDAGSQRITIAGSLRTPEGARNAPRVELAIIDDGHGMAPNVQAKAFEPLFTTRPEGQGTGLGLATAHGVVTRHGGTIELESAEGVGTTVRVLLPYADEREESETPTAANPAGRDTEADILLVESDAILREGVTQMLVRAGFATTSVATRAEAWSHLETRSVDLVICDTRLLDGPGTEVARALQERGAPIPVLYTAGSAPAGLLPRKARVVLKPYTAEMLIEQIRLALASANGVGRNGES